MTTKTLSNREKLEIMEKHMRVSWSEIDAFLEERSHGADTRENLGLEWAENKYDLFKLFGDKLVLTKTVENTITSSEAERSIRTNFEGKASSILSQEDYQYLLVYMGQFSHAEILANTLENDKYIKGKKITKGTKLSRSFKQFIPKDKLDAIQTEFSVLNQKLMASGTLELSIEPIDILASSVNSDGRWRSCHNVLNGEYASGAVAYTVDSATAVAQIYNDRDENNIALKTWRQLVYFDDKRKLAALGRQYPSVNTNNAKTLTSLMKEEIYDGARTGFVGEHAISRIMKNHGGCHYNDITNGHANKVRVVSLVSDFDGMYGSKLDNEKQTFRAFQDNFSDLGVEYNIGVYEVPAVDNRNYALGDYDEGCIFSSECEDW